MSHKFRINCERIIDALRSDSDLNTPNNLRWPCNICNKNVTPSMKAIQCDSCNKWIHIKCNDISAVEYDYFSSTNDDIDWNCLYCTLKFNHEKFPFTLVDDVDIYKLINSDSVNFSKFIPSPKIIEETAKFNVELQENDDSEHVFPRLLNSKFP